MSRGWQGTQCDCSGWEISQVGLPQGWGISQVVLSRGWGSWGDNVHSVIVLGWEMHIINLWPNEVYVTSVHIFSHYRSSSSRPPKGQFVPSDLCPDLYCYPTKFGWITINSKGTRANYVVFTFGDLCMQMMRPPILTYYGTKWHLIVASGCGAGAWNVRTYVRTDVQRSPLYPPCRLSLMGDNNGCIRLLFPVMGRAHLIFIENCLKEASWE
jgi:hypothetical protein